MRPVRWRILSLAIVHVLIVAHLVHWKLAGRTLASIQLSDAGRFAAEGVATAAFFFFAALLIITMLFGRFFCSWGCHMLALQELCRVLLGRLGIRPRLMRSRLMWVVPFAAAFHIFFQPAVERWWFGSPLPSATIALTSDNVWASLPGPWTGLIAALVCAPLMVYVLGSLSFCKYVCPYGALFSLSDRLAVGRIRLTGTCDGCARCTAACTTGVRVHEEVQRLSMVANAGCMRCFECVSACPQGVLAYRFGRPSVLAASQRGLTHYAFSWPEELLLCTAFGISFIALYDLYQAVPLFLSLAASALIGYLAVIAARMSRPSRVVFRGIALRRPGGVTRAGAVVVALSALLLVVVAHSLAIQYHERRAAAALVALAFPRSGPAITTAEQQLARAATADLDFCVRYGLVDTVDWNMKLAWTYRLLADAPQVEAHLRRAVAIDGSMPVPHFNLGKELLRQGRRLEAAHAFSDAVRLAPSLAPHVPAGLLDGSAASG